MPKVSIYIRVYIILAHCVVLKSMRFKTLSYCKLNIYVYRYIS